MNEQIVHICKNYCKDMASAFGAMGPCLPWSSAPQAAKVLDILNELYKALEQITFTKKQEAKEPKT